MEYSARHQKRLIRLEKDKCLAKLFAKKIKNGEKNDDETIFASADEEEAVCSTSASNSIQELDGAFARKKKLISDLGEWHLTSKISNKHMRELLVILKNNSIDVSIPSTSSCNSCKNLHQKLCEIIEEQQKLKDTINNLQETIETQNKFIVEMLAEQKVRLQMVNNINKIEKAGTNSIISKFPLETEQEIIAMDEEINEANLDKHVLAVKHLINGDIKKNFENLLTRDLCIEYNVDGICGKKSLKQHKKVFDVFIFAIGDTGPDPEKEMKKAFQVVKKRQFRCAWAKKKGIQVNNTQETETVLKMESEMVLC